MKKTQKVINDNLHYDDDTGIKHSIRYSLWDHRESCDLNVRL